MRELMRELDDDWPNASNLAFVEGLYASFLRDPASVGSEWRTRFERFANNGSSLTELRPGPSFEARSIFNPPPRSAVGGVSGAGVGQDAVLQDRVDRLIRAYRVRGHRMAQLDPLGLPVPAIQELDPGYHGLSEADMDKPVSAITIAGTKDLTLRGVIERMRNTYCRSIGVEYMHIDELPVRWWLRDRMESSENRIELKRAEQLRILTRLTDAVIFESFLHQKYRGAKSFSLDGAESLIPLLDLAIERAGEQGIDEIVLAMAHRGRLNVLANILGKAPRDIFREFDDADPELHRGSGDVKYHVGHSTDWITGGNRKVHLSLCFNPSHLEFVNPVALGRLRAKQDRSGDASGSRGLAILIHGDAAFAGEGITQETLNLSQLPAYATGGTLHVIVNNQIGFTTTPAEGRSSHYASAVAKLLPIPIFHVNGEDPEAVAQVVSLSMDFRKEFKRDVIIDMYCYRRHGHNEGDEPAFTQPVMYRAIESRASVREAHLERLLKMGQVTSEEAAAIADDRRAELEKGLSEARSVEYKPRSEAPAGVWSGYGGGPERDAGTVSTAVERNQLTALLEALTRLPSGFHPHPKIERWLEARREMASGKRPVDWSAAEALAFATLASGGTRVRLSGQDSARGTFSHRHAVLHDFENGHTFMSLERLGEGFAPVQIFNSPLSEVGVLGFEYGYSLDCPGGLVLWEAQFGDFMNAAQVVIDQFLVSAEDKWRRLSGIVLLLPHGFEGMGPEHSSARLERFLALAAEDNLQVVNLTTPAQYFHCLRRQALRRWRKPLVIMSPKSLLRHPRVVSTLDELAAEEFKPVLPSASNPAASQVERILLCSGKIAIELEERAEALRLKNVAILRLEQFYPLPLAQLEIALAPYPRGAPVLWVQEEPENMGALRFLRLKLGPLLFGKHPFNCISRPESASPATGSAKSHKLEQEELLSEALQTGPSNSSQKS